MHWSSITMALASEPPRISPIFRSASSSFTNVKVLAGASSRLNDRGSRSAPAFGPSGRMMVVHEALHAEFIGGIDSDAAVAIANSSGLTTRM